MSLKITPAVLAAIGNNELSNALIAATPGGIEAQELAGQQALCASSQLPINMIRCTRQEFESLGFVFLDPPSDDQLFIRVHMPKGWELRPTDRAMWSDLVDESGKPRFLVFYKAAFYDRRAHIEPANG